MRAGWSVALLVGLLGAEPSSALAQVAPAAAGSGALVDIRTDNPRVVLERRIGSPSPYWEPDWERVCATPCLRPIPAGGVYRIGGEGVTPSDGLQLHEPRTELRVSAGSSSARSLGAYMTVFGFLVAAAGGVFLVMSAVSHADTGTTENRVGGIVSGVALGAGSLVGIGGIVLFVVNGTTVRDESGKPIARRGRPIGLNAAVRF